MSQQSLPSWTALPVATVRRLEKLCSRFENAWKTGSPPRIEDYLEEVVEAERPFLVRELLALELVYRRMPPRRPSSSRSF
jgi:serine/threonine-protein kinase